MIKKWSFLEFPGSCGQGFFKKMGIFPFLGKWSFLAEFWPKIFDFGLASVTKAFVNVKFDQKIFWSNFWLNFWSKVGQNGPKSKNGQKIAELTSDAAFSEKPIVFRVWDFLFKKIRNFGHYFTRDLILFISLHPSFIYHHSSSSSFFISIYGDDRRCSRET